MDEAVVANALAQRKKDKSIAWQPYLPHDDKQDIQEIYERLDVDSKGYITQRELHAALNDALGKPVRAETVRALATRMDATSRRGQHVSYNDFVEYMAQKLLVKESYDDLMRTEQGILMREVGYKLHEVLSMYKRKQMIKDAMTGSDGIARLLHLTSVPAQHRNRRKGQSGSDFMTHIAEPTNAATTPSTPAARNRPQRPASGVAKAVGASSSARRDASRNVSVAFRSLGPEDPNSAPSTSAASRRSLAAVPSSVSVSASASASKTTSGWSRQNHQSSGAVSRVPSSVSLNGGRLSDGKDKEKEREKDVEKDRERGREKEREPVSRWRKGMGLPATEDSSAAIAWAAEDAIAFVSELSSLNTRLKEGLAVRQPSHPHPHPHPHPHSTSTSTSTGALPPSRQPASSSVSTPISGGSVPASPSALNGPGGSPAPCASPELAPDGATPKWRTYSTSTASAPPVLVPRPPLGIAIPGRSVSRCASPAPSPLGPACQLLVSGSPVAGSGLPWRSPALHSQVMELEHAGISDSQVLSLDDPQSHGVLAGGLTHSHAHLPQHRSQLRRPPSMWIAARTSMPAMAPLPSPTSPSRSQTLPSRHWSAGPVGGPAGRGTAVSPARAGGATGSGYMPALPSGTGRAATANGDMEGRAGSGAPSPPSPPQHQLHPQQQQQHPFHRGLPQHQQHQLQHQHQQLSAPPLLPQPASSSQSGEEERLPASEGSKRAWMGEGAEVEPGLGPRLHRTSLSSSPGLRGRSRLPSRPPWAEVPLLEVAAGTAASAAAATAAGAGAATNAAVTADPLASDPILSKLPNWIRKGIGLPTPAMEPPFQLEPHPDPVALAAAAAQPVIGGEGSNRDAAMGGELGSHRVINQRQMPGAGLGQDGEEVDEEGRSGAQRSCHRRPGSAGGGAASVAAGPGTPETPAHYARALGVRFVPFGGDASAVVAEAMEEGEAAAAEVPSWASQLREPLAPIDPGESSPLSLSTRSGDENAPADDELKAAEGATPGEGNNNKDAADGAGPAMPHDGAAAAEAAAAAAAALNGARRPTSPRSSLSWGATSAASREPGTPDPDGLEEEAQAPSRPTSARFFEPKFFSFRHPESTDEAPVRAEGPLRKEKDNALPTREELSAWEASVLSQRSSVGHGSVPGREHEVAEEEQAEMGPDTAEEIFARLFGAPAKDAPAVPAGGGHGPLEPGGGAPLPGGDASNPPDFNQPAPMHVPPVRMPYIEPVSLRQTTTRPPTAGSVVVGAMAAVVVAERAAAEAASGGGSSSSSDTRSGAAGPGWAARRTRWSTGYVNEPGQVGAAGHGATAGCATPASAPTPAVRLNHAAMLRLHTQYSVEAIAAAGTALGVGGTSATARDVAERELLQTLRAGSGAAGQGGGARRSCACAGTLPRTDRAAEALRGSSSCSHTRSSSSSGSGGSRDSANGSGGGPGRAGDVGLGLQGTAANGLQPTPIGLLPSDIVALGRRYRRHISHGRKSADMGHHHKRLSPNEPTRGSRPRSAIARAVAAAAPGPAPRVSGGGTRWAEREHRPGSARGPGSDGRPGGSPADAAVAAAVAAGAMSPPGQNGASASASSPVRPASGPSSLLPRPQSARAPVAHTPPSIVSRVRHLHEGEVASCFAAGAVLPAVAQPGSGSTGGDVQQRAEAQQTPRGRPPVPAAPPTPPSLASSPSFGPLLGAHKGMRASGDGGGVVGSAVPGDGTRGASCEGSAAEERPRRVLEVMGRVESLRPRRSSSGAGLGVSRDE